MKKLISVLLAAVLVLCVCSAAMAANYTQNGIAGEATAVTWKDIFTVSDDASDPQNLPAATFAYTIEAGTGAAATETSPLVKDGVGSPTIENAVHTATAAGTTISTVDVTADFSGVTFEEPGIYRYDVTVDLDTSNSEDDIEVDVNNEADSGHYVLDVYVQRVNNNGAITFKPYAYALSKTGEFQEFNTETMQAIYSGTDPEGKIDKVTHELTTYNLTITKKITGTASANEFDFEIKINGVPTDVIINQDDAANPTAGNQTFTATLKDGKKTVIQGLPSKAQYEIFETVNKLEGYTVVVEVNGTEVGTDAYNWVTNDDETFGSQNKTAMGKGDVDVVFINNLDNISPTGVVLRVAPYALILIAGVALLLISRRRRTEKE